MADYQENSSLLMAISAIKNEGWSDFRRVVLELLQNRINEYAPNDPIRGELESIYAQVSEV